MPYFVYLLECSDGSYYCGIAKDLEKRLLLHNKGFASKYTHSRLPAKLVFSEKKQSKGAALKREAQIKRLSRKEKQGLVEGKN